MVGFLAPIFFGSQAPLVAVMVVLLNLAVLAVLAVLLVAWQALVFRYRHTDRRLAPSAAFDAALWLSILAIGFVAARVSWSLLG